MLAIMEDVDSGDQKEYIKKFINFFLCDMYIIYTYFFKGNRMRMVLGTSGYMLVTMEDVEVGDHKEIKKLINIFVVVI